MNLLAGQEAGFVERMVFNERADAVRHHAQTLPPVLVPRKQIFKNFVRRGLCLQTGTFDLDVVCETSKKRFVADLNDDDIIGDGRAPVVDQNGVAMRDAGGIHGVAVDGYDKRGLLVAQQQVGEVYVCGANLNVRCALSPDARILGRIDAVFQGLHVGLGLHNQRADPLRTAAVDEGASLLFRYANDDVAVVRNAFDRLAAGTGAMAAAS